MTSSGRQQREKRFSLLTKDELIKVILDLQDGLIRVEQQTSSELLKCVEELRLIQKDFEVIKWKVERGIPLDL